MRKCFLHILFLIITAVSFSQTTVNLSEPGPASVNRPKLVVGLVIDQMRWDFLYRYYDRYLPDGGFKRLLNNGFSCENTFVNYLPSVTACGHTAIFSGAFPAVSGITGNDWWDYKKNNFVYCSGDDSVQTIGSVTDLGKMSPRNMLVNTIGDELKLATNFRSKIFGIALKDRGAILSAGHSADAAYWYDEKTGDWISSSYYMKTLPAWVTAINKRKMVDSCYKAGWKLLYPLETYTQSYTTKTSFEYDFSSYVGKNYGFIRIMPQGNNFTIEMAKNLIANENLGTDNETDLLAISFSTPDYVGHTFGPNSVEAEDVYLRLDKELGDFLNYLDNKIGKNQYLVFLTADHGASNAPPFLKAKNLPAGNVDVETIYYGLNTVLEQQYKVPNLCVTFMNYQLYLDRDSISKYRLNSDSIGKTCIDYLLQHPGIENAFLQKDISRVVMPAKIKEMVSRGFNASRSGEIQIIFKQQWIEGLNRNGTTHGGWNPYDTHIPLLFYGWNIKPGSMNSETYITDIAPTISSLLKIQMPNGCTGKVITEILQ